MSPTINYEPGKLHSDNRVITISYRGNEDEVAAILEVLEQYRMRSAILVPEWRNDRLFHPIRIRSHPFPISGTFKVDADSTLIVDVDAKVIIPVAVNKQDHFLTGCGTEHIDFQSIEDMEALERAILMVVETHKNLPANTKWVRDSFNNAMSKLSGMIKNLGEEIKKQKKK